jgi:hypothetical protein
VQKRLDLRRAVLGNTLDFIDEFVSVASKGKNSKFQIGVSGVRIGACPSGVIQTCSGVVDDFGDQNTPTKWEPLSQTKFMSFVNAISIRLSNSGVWLFGKKLSI